MAILKYDKAAFLQALEPGIVAYVMQEFEKNLEKELNGAVERAYSELRKSAPENIKAKIHSIMDMRMGEERVKVEVNLSMPDNKGQ